MKKFILILFFVSLYGCQDSAVNTVKESRYYIDRTYTVEQVFDNRSVCSSIEWLEFSDDRGRKTVEYRCKLIDANGFLDMSLNQTLAGIESRAISEYEKTEHFLNQQLNDLEVLPLIIEEIEKIINSQGEYRDFTKIDEQLDKLKGTGSRLATDKCRIDTLRTSFEYFEDDCFLRVTNYLLRIYDTSIEYQDYINSFNENLLMLKNEATAEYMSEAVQVFQWGVAELEGEVAADFTYAGFELTYHSGDIKSVSADLVTLVESVYEDSAKTMSDYNAIRSNVRNQINKVPRYSGPYVFD